MAVGVPIVVGPGGRHHHVWIVVGPMSGDHTKYETISLLQDLGLKE